MFLLDYMDSRDLAGLASGDAAMCGKFGEEELCAGKRHIHGQNGLVLSVGTCAQAGCTEADVESAFPRKSCLGPVQNPLLCQCGFQPC